MRKLLVVCRLRDIYILSAFVGQLKFVRICDLYTRHACGAAPSAFLQPDFLQAVSGPLEVSPMSSLTPLGSHAIKVDSKNPDEL